MDVGTFRDGSQWHRPLRDIGLGGESPAVKLRRGDMGRLMQMNEWVDHQGEGLSCHPALR